MSSCPANFCIFSRDGFTVLARLVLNYRPQVIHHLGLPKCWDYWREPLCPALGDFFLFKTGFHHVCQAGLELPTSGDPSALASKVLGMSHHAWPLSDFSNPISLFPLKSYSCGCLRRGNGQDKYMPGSARAARRKARDILPGIRSGAHYLHSIFRNFPFPVFAKGDSFQVT